jgi:hypothetical protein
MAKVSGKYGLECNECHHNEPNVTPDEPGRVELSMMGNQAFWVCPECGSAEVGFYDYREDTSSAKRDDAAIEAREG